MITALHELQPEAIALLRRHNLLAPLAQGLVAEEAVAAIDLEPSQQEQLLEEWSGDQTREEALEAVRRKLGWNAATASWQVQLPVKLQRLARERFLPKAEARFLQRKGQLDQVTYSLVRVRDQALARELYLRLAAGEASFADVAEQYSEGPERLTRGLIAARPIASAHPHLAEMLRTARDGEVLQPFQVEAWWLVVRREQFLPAELNEEMAERMAQELLQEWMRSEAERLMAELPAMQETVHA